MRLAICTFITAFAAYMYIDARNQMIEMQLAIPPLQKKLRNIQSENNRLQFEVDRFESPSHLMQIAERVEFSHFKPVNKTEILTVP